MDSKRDESHKLIPLFDQIVNTEGKAVITPEFRDITSNDMHIIKAIGTEHPKKMGEVAALLPVTLGTLTIAVNGLVKKGYVKRERGTLDRRVVYVSLSDKGKKAYQHYQEFHKGMLHAFTKDLSKEEIAKLIQALQNLQDFFEEYRKDEN